MIDSISLSSSFESYSNIAAFEDSPSKTEEAKHPSLNPSALHPYEILIPSEIVIQAKLIQAKVNYLALEKETDDLLSTGVKSSWNTYQKNDFYRTTASLYYTAALRALKLSQFEDAVRIMEKEAWVYAEQLNMGSRAFDLLLSAWTLSKQIGDTEKRESILEKLQILTDKDIASCRSIQSQSIDSSSLSEREWIDSDSSETLSTASSDSTDFMQDFYDNALVHALLRKAEMLEITGSSSHAIPFYEEAGQLCLALYDKGVSFGPGSTSLALMAGLCFEKSEKTQDLARLAYERLIKNVSPYFPWEDSESQQTYYDSLGRLSVKEKLQMEYFIMIMSLPAYLETSVACLKCGKADLFEKIIEHQLKQFIASVRSCREQIEEPYDDDEYESDDQHISAYMKALLRVSKTLLGSNALSEIETLMHEAAGSVLEQNPNSWGHKAEMELLNVFTASKDTPVKEMLWLLDQDHILRP